MIRDAMPKISVIIPVYQSEAFLPACLDSVVGQTCEGLEIILVDDGSTDRSGEICEEYARRDARVRVIHKANGGVSSARNAGLSAAAGEWIGWVDSDDWIEADHFAEMLKAATESGADIVAAGRYEEYRNTRRYRGPSERRELSAEEALELLLEDDELQNYLWDKLWRRELFREVRFPEGKTFEDVALMGGLIFRAGKIVCLPVGKYHYRIVPTGIVGNCTLRNKFNFYYAHLGRLKELGKRSPRLKKRMEDTCVFAIAGIWCSYYASPAEQRREYAGELAKASAFAREHYRPRRRGSLGLAGRLAVRLTRYPARWSYGLAWGVNQLYRLKNGRYL